MRNLILPILWGFFIILNSCEIDDFAENTRIKCLPIYFIDDDNDTTFFEANDGGIYKTTNGGTSWTDLTDGMVISQIYKLGVSQTVQDEIITGLQDNGSKLISSDIWYDVNGGDGMECLIDYEDEDIQYSSLY